MKTQEALETLDAMQRQIIHGSTVFKDIGDVIRNLTLANHINPASLDLAKARLDESAPGEVLHMVAALIALSEDTNDYAGDCAADGFTLTADTARQRASYYERSADALCEIWGAANA